ncbi:hypothetical protein [Actinomyces oricola]|uniref:hypothetical protein n=1 Tax=Actinomyces oricola TaxID=206043 RepID=UPI0013E8DD0B|nr:hypothetical protein [Actinomyces oricola]
MRRLERVGPGWRLAIVTVLALAAIALFMTFEVRSLHSALRFRLPTLVSRVVSV